MTWVVFQYQFWEQKLQKKTKNKTVHCFCFVILFIFQWFYVVVDVLFSSHSTRWIEPFYWPFWTLYTLKRREKKLCEKVHITTKHIESHKTVLSSERIKIYNEIILIKRYRSDSFTHTSTDKVSIVLLSSPKFLSIIIPLKVIFQSAYKVMESRQNKNYIEAYFQN